jgi:PAS domain S-box-containing protein
MAWLVAAAALVGLGVAISFLSFSQIGEAADARRHAATVLRGGNQLMAALVDAETGQRGYLLTGDEAYLEPYLAVRGSVVDRLNTLRKLTVVAEAEAHLDALVPLVDAKLAFMARAIALRRSGDLPAALALTQSGEGRRLMDTIRVRMGSYIGLEEAALGQREAQFQQKMNRLFNIIVVASLMTVLLALAFVYFIYLQSRQRVKNLVHEETRHLLEQQEATNKALQQANLTLQISEEKLAVTLHSIGDAVIATDAQARITLLNPLAEQLTGWTLAQAAGRPVDEIFHIISKDSRQPATIPVMDTLAHGTVQGLANHTVLIARDGSESDIADSCAPIRDSNAQVVGAVLVFRNVTGEYAAQQALRDSAALIQTILNTVVDGIITIQARGGIVEKVNPAAERIFGYTAAELAGQSFSMLIPELDQDQRNGSLAYYSASDAARAVGLGREVTGRRKDGTLFPMEIAVSEMSLGGQRYFTGILRDISARKQAEEALRKAGALQSAIFNSANFSSIATDARGVIQIFNVGAERMLGYAAGDVMNKITPADISDPQELIVRAKALSTELGTQIEPGFEALVFKASRGIEDIYALTYIRKDGSRFPAVVSVTALRSDDDTIIGYLLIGTDNTARMHVEAERTLLYEALKDKNAELESAKSTAESASKAKTDFLSSMSHELRTPLNAILGFTQLMESGTPAPTPVQKRNLDQILKAGWYLLELINEILDLAMIESGKATLSTEPVSLAEVMLECRSMIEPQAQKRGLAMSFPQFEARWFVKADRTRIKQVLINLLFNATKYNRPGGEVAVVCTRNRTGFIRISIRDTGVGMTPEQVGQLFQPFNRLGREAGAEEGTGIGLVVTKRLVELMGGTIGVESTVGVGSVFWVDLRLTTAPQLYVNPAENTTLAPRQAPDGTPVRTLLYVEDNPANLELVDQLIARRNDLRLLSAADGRLGIEYARMYQPAMILMDINLPGISGIEAMKILHADPATAHIPIIALSANAVPRDIERTLEAGFFNYLTKPIKVNQFMDALDVALKFAQTSTGSPATKEIA